MIVLDHYRNYTTFPEYTYKLPFERSFSLQDAHNWIVPRWTMSFYVVAVYGVLILAGQRFMRNRERLELRPLLFIWNSALAAFSILGAVRTAPELLHTLFHHGMTYSVCIPPTDQVTVFWIYLFALSKIPELGDTAFIILRKQPLILLHWYHHMSVLLYTWYAATGYQASGRWFTVINYTIHSLMYSYYALKSIGYRPSKFFQISITCLQLAQMAIGVSINVIAYKLLTSDDYLHGNRPCCLSLLNVKLSSAMYLSYLILFGNFFYNSYVKKSPARQKKA